jgi:Fic/DOC family
MTDWIGYKWLAEKYQVRAIQEFRITSKVGRSRATLREDGRIHETYLAPTRPEDTFIGHLTFALKHEGVHLEFLARLFKILPKAELENWINLEPTGQYARRACFLYEWLTQNQLNFPGVSRGNYIDALDEELYLTAKISVNNPRWRIRDNLPGVPSYCPMVMRTEQVKLAEKYDFKERLRALEAEFGVDILIRSVVWLTVKESRASFAIEHEESNVDRVRRFAAVMERRCGQYENTLEDKILAQLQSEILGDRATRYGLRKSPVFVGEMSHWSHIVHYIAPNWHDVPSMLSGLGEFDIRTKGKSSLLRAAIISFGFVYIHPMSDGNGRISRFLVNDILRRDGAVPPPFILPISAAITNTPIKRRGYDEILELFSKPFMQHYQSDYRFGVEQVGEDGVHYNLMFDAYDDANAAWRYLDLTAHVEYLAEIVDLTIKDEMRQEASYLHNFHQARAAVKEILDGPDVEIDRIIRSIHDNNGKISNKLREEFPQLGDSKLSDSIIFAINKALKSE